MDVTKALRRRTVETFELRLSRQTLIEALQGPIGGVEIPSSAALAVVGPRYKSANAVEERESIPLTADHALVLRWEIES